MEKIEFDPKESKKFYVKLLDLKSDVKELLRVIPLNNNENLETLHALNAISKAVKNSIGIMQFSGYHKGLPIRDIEDMEEYTEGLLGAIKYYAGRKNSVYSRS